MNFQQIIDETGYLERDVDNLKAIFNEYARPEAAGDKPTMSVAQFREFFRATKLKSDQAGHTAFEKCNDGFYAPGYGENRFCRVLSVHEKIGTG